MKLTPAQKRDMLLISVGDICEYSIGFRSTRENFYKSTTGFNYVRNSMVNKLKSMGLIEDGELYRERYPKYENGWGGSGWGRFLKLTEKGEEVLLR